MGRSQNTVLDLRRPKQSNERLERDICKRLKVLFSALLGEQIGTLSHALDEVSFSAPYAAARNCHDDCRPSMDIKSFGAWSQNKHFSYKRRIATGVGGYVQRG